jgi:hypothetical protein
MKNVRVYDLGEDAEVIDRYTVVRLDWEETRDGLKTCFGMSEHPTHPQGFGQHGAAMPGRHLGKLIAFSELPEECQRAAEHMTR